MWSSQVSVEYLPHFMPFLISFQLGGEATPAYYFSVSAVTLLPTCPAAAYWLIVNEAEWKVSNGMAAKVLLGQPPHVADGEIEARWLRVSSATPHWRGDR